MTIEMFKFEDEFGIFRFGVSGEDKDFICDVCAKSLTEGYVCKKIGVICMDCQKERDNTQKWKCMLFGENEHAHTKFKRVQDEHS